MRNLRTNPVSSYLDLLDDQLNRFLPILLANESRLWVRRLPGEWSPGEQLDHLAAVHHFFTAIHKAFWLPASLLAQLRAARPYVPEIDDVYARPGFPLGAGRLWSPRRGAKGDASLDGLVDLLRNEHLRIRRFFSSKPEGALGRAPLYFPSIGWINYIQSLRIAVYHDAHHFASILQSLTAQKD